MSEEKILDAAMDNRTAWTLGRIAQEAGAPTRTDVGDKIDRGLILLRLLREAGFGVIELRALAPPGGAGSRNHD